MYKYDDQNTDFRARGNLLKIELVSPPRIPPPSSVFNIITYEPRYHRIKSIQDENGKITTWIYDYEEGIGNIDNIVRVKYPSATLPDGTSQDRVEYFKYNSFGQITEYKTGGRASPHLYL